jgi:acetyltransferase-like isoleucine patch superfamily enzyme
MIVAFGPLRRAWCWSVLLGVPVARVGCHTKFRGHAHFSFSSNLRVGDFCWIEAVSSYGGALHEPALVIGANVAISDLTHISCVNSVTIGDGCLLGSKIYIGDHSHGRASSMTVVDLATAPALRPLDDISPIYIGANCWIGDGAVILADTYLAAGSIVGANSVVKLHCKRPAVIAGIPARVVRYLDVGEVADVD